MAKKPKQPICSICKQPYDNFGNNAQPINDGRCCDICNDLYVIPVRIGQIYLGTKDNG